MIKTLAKSIREYKRPSILSPIFVSVEVILECLMPLVVSIPLQMLAYYIAINKNRNVDQPRNLAKSVTVE